MALKLFCFKDRCELLRAKHCSTAGSFSAFVADTDPIAAFDRVLASAQEKPR